MAIAKKRDNERQRIRLEQRLLIMRRRLEQAYTDKLDGRITEEFWESRTAEWRREEEELRLGIAELSDEKPGRLIDATRILELANKAHYLYVRQTPHEKAKLLKIVLSNCVLDSANAYPTYRKPFDLIFQAAQTERWWAWGESNS